MRKNPVDYKKRLGGYYEKNTYIYLYAAGVYTCGKYADIFIVRR